MSEFIQLKDASIRVGVSRDTLRRAIVKGELAAIRTVGKTGPQYEVNSRDLDVWAQQRSMCMGQLVEDDAQPGHAAHQDPQADEKAKQAEQLGGEAPDLSILVERLEDIENIQNAQSGALVKLATQQEYLKMAQVWQMRAAQAKRKLRKAQQAQQASEQAAQQAQQLAEENLRRLEAFQKEQQSRVEELEIAKRKIEWLEKRVPRWVRSLFGAS